MRLVLEGDKRRPLMDEFQSVVSISFSSSSWRRSARALTTGARFVSNPRAFFGVARQELVAFSVETRVTILIYRKKHMWLARANPSRARFSSRDGLANVLFDYSGIGRPLPRKVELQLKRLERARSFVKNSPPRIGGAYLPVWLASSLAHWSNFSVRSAVRPPAVRLSLKTYSHFLAQELIRRPVCLEEQLSRREKKTDALD